MRNSRYFSAVALAFALVAGTPFMAEPVQAQQRLTDFATLGYGGPSPPRGHGTHHYHFKLYALARTAGTTGAH